MRCSLHGLLNCGGSCGEERQSGRGEEEAVREVLIILWTRNEMLSKVWYIVLKMGIQLSWLILSDPLL